MKSRLGSLSFAIAILIWGAARADADILAVETGATTPDVLRFTPAGARSTFATANLDNPVGINADAAGNVYVVNQGASPTSTFHDSVAQFSPTGTPLGFFVTPATPPGNTLNAPVDIAFDGAGQAYVTSGTLPNPPYGYVAQYSPAGVFQLSFGLANTNLPTGIGYNPVNGLLYVVNSATTGDPGPNLNSFLIYNPAPGHIGDPPTIVTPGGQSVLDGGQQIAFDQNGNVFIASFGIASGVPISRVNEYTAAGTYIRTIATTTAGAVGVAYDPTSNILYVSYQNTNPGPGAGFIEKYAFNGSSFTDAGALATGLNGAQFLLYLDPVPEPGSVVLMGLGLVAMAGCYRVRRSRAA